ncbi:MAG TPA: DUF58 domain-containing protein [Burkholderiales bacterium]|nr:DUF58 domain-containing protein [Burkholderiales bacterium]
MFKWLRTRSAAEDPSARVVPLRVRSPDAVLRRVEWTVLRRLDGLLHGDYRTLFRGYGLDLADLREYQYGDDVRHIDWNVTARLQTPYIREYHEDREITAWFLLDLSPSVDFGSNEVRKRAVSEAFVAAVGRLLTRHGNRIGALLYGSGVESVIPAGSGRRHLLRILHAMGTPRNAGDAPQGRKTDLSDLLRAAAHMVHRRSVLFVVSDFFSEPGWERLLGSLVQRHEIVAVRLYDPLESELPDLGLIPFRDAETGEQVLVDTHDPSFRARFAAAAERRESALRAGFAESGVDVLELSTSDDLVDSLLRFSDLRRRRSRTSGAMPKAAA